MIIKSPFERLDIPSISLSEYVTEHFEEYGDSIAFVNGATGEKMSYRQLLDAIHRVAFSLRARGFKKGDTLAIYSPNCPEYAAVFFAVAWLGGINTTINPTYTAEELAFQLNDSEARILVTIPGILDKAVEAAEHAGIEEIIVFGEAEGLHHTIRCSAKEKLSFQFLAILMRIWSYFLIQAAQQDYRKV